MLLFDQESGQPRRSAHSLPGSAGVSGRALDEIAREIEDAQRQQTETMTDIAGRLRTVDSGRPSGMRAPPRAYMMLEEAGDEPWDAGAAEELMQGHEAAATETTQPGGPDTMSYAQQAWIGERFNDVTQRITQALSDLKPGSTVTVLEERLDAFQAHLDTALQDVAKRTDLEGMRLIEAHVNDLADKLNELERTVSHIDGIESDLRTVMQQVSDERIAKLLNADSRFAADLDAVARRAAEEMHARLAPEGTALAERHDALRRLVESSIADRREAEAHAVSLVTSLSGRVNAQADGYAALKGLLEQAIQEQRKNEQTAVGMLETVQQALVTVLDRMDALEQQQRQETAAAEPPSQQGPILGPPPLDARDLEPPTAEETAAGDASYTFRDTRFDGFSASDASDPSDPVEVPAAFSDPVAPTEPSAVDASESPLDRLRRDFIADARRAKLKAAANRAEALGEHVEATTESVVDETRALLQAKAPETNTGSGRLFGMSTKLLAGVLALIVAINGALLLFNRASGSRPVAPEIARPNTTELPGATGSHAPAGVERTSPRSELGSEPAPFPYGFHDDVLNPPDAIEPTGDTSASDVPHGMTLTGGSEPALSYATVAGVYEQQVLASLSGKLGMIAAGQSASALLPEAHGRFSAAYPQPEIDPVDEGGQRVSRLTLPPATVGPMSLRVAAANGDASAEFEVGARLAEGNGTGQDYAEAVRWYQRSAAKGFAQAQYRLGTLYERGLGVGKDLERAKVWYQRAAEGGNVKSMHNLAVLIAGGERPNYAGALPWFLKAAEHGLADSQFNLGVLMENGLGGAADRIGAYKWYALAARSGDGDATQRRDALASALSADELASADGMIAAFQALHATPLANDARAAGEDWKKRVNNDTNT